LQIRIRGYATGTWIGRLAWQRRAANDRQLTVSEQGGNVALRTSRDEAAKDIVTTNLLIAQRAGIAVGIAVIPAIEAHQAGLKGGQCSRQIVQGGRRTKGLPEQINVSRGGLQILL